MTAPAPNATKTSEASDSPTPYDLVRFGMTGATMLWPSASTVAGRYSERTSCRDRTPCHRSCPTGPLRWRLFAGGGHRVDELLADLLAAVVLPVLFDLIVVGERSAAGDDVGDAFVPGAIDGRAD